MTAGPTFAATFIDGKRLRMSCHALHYTLDVKRGIILSRAAMKRGRKKHATRANRCALRKRRRRLREYTAEERTGGAAMNGSAAQSVTV